MHSVLEAIKNELSGIEAQIRSMIPSNEPFNVAQGNWGFPGLSRDDLLEDLGAVRSVIDQYPSDELGPHEAELTDCIRRLAYVRVNTIQNIWGNAGAGVPALLLTLDFVKRKLSRALIVSNDQMSGDASVRLTKLLRQLRGYEARMEEIAPRTDKVASMLDQIEEGHSLSSQLAIDLKDLGEARAKVAAALEGVKDDRESLDGYRKQCRESSETLATRTAEAEAVLRRCDEAYRATTSEGLASAFSQRASQLGFSMWVWVVGLAISLGLGFLLGSTQLQRLLEAARGGQSDVGVFINAFLSLLSIGAPVWFAWVATKQIGQRFRLAEDYGFKAAISKAYEGYRREALLVDPQLQLRLFQSAISRLDEQPLRLVETDTHGSPWHELANSDAFKKAIETVPGFAEKLLDATKNALPKSTADKPAEKSAPEVATKA